MCFGDLADHPCQLFLNQLARGDRFVVKMFAEERVLQQVPCQFGNHDSFSCSTPLVRLYTWRMPSPDLLASLQRYWGYSSFRPLQEQVVQSLLGAHDTCVVMPTGGGKSLCYQLPALALGKTAVVISPLIALMQDQAMHLAHMGIPAAVLNSMQDSAEQSRVMMKARAGDYRLIYLSPERLAREDTIGWLRGVPVSFFAILTDKLFVN